MNNQRDLASFRPPRLLSTLQTKLSVELADATPIPRTHRESSRAAYRLAVACGVVRPEHRNPSTEQ
jgi:hypothetical protein